MLSSSPEVMASSTRGFFSFVSGATDFVSIVPLSTGFGLSPVATVFGSLLAFCSMAVGLLTIFRGCDSLRFDGEMIFVGPRNVSCRASASDRTFFDVFDFNAGFNIGFAELFCRQNSCIRNRFSASKASCSALLSLTATDSFNNVLLAAPTVDDSI